MFAKEENRENIGQRPDGKEKPQMELPFHQRKDERYRIILEQTKTLVLEYDYRTNEFYIDSSINKYLSGDFTAIRLKPIAGLQGIVYRPDMPALLEMLDLTGVSGVLHRERELRLYTAAKAYEWFRVSLSLLVGSQGDKERVIITINNVHDEVISRKKLEFLAERDQLTKIPNRDTFSDQTRQMLDSDLNTEYVMIRMDIERFRLVDQLFGPEEGDRMLRYFAVKLQESVESEELGTYCRVASDIFAICMPNDPDMVKRLLDQIQLAAQRYPLKYELILSFGLYVIDERFLPINTMLDRAALAQKTIKGNYVTHIAYYDQALKEQEQREQQILAEMNTALVNGQFEVFFQPKCRIDTGTVVGAEALVRWRHPERGLIAPGEFIPLFERNGFITALDSHVWMQTCILIRKWLNQGKKVLPISVNVSRVDLYNPKLLETILAHVDKYDIPRHLLKFELTESSFVADIIQLTEITRELQSEGFRVLMDDFGSGYSSLNSLKDIVVDELKIDLKFLMPSRHDDRAGCILSSVISMAKRLGMTIVAEGVETGDQAEFLQSIGCSIAQGYYYYRPMPVGDYELLVNDEQQQSNVARGSSPSAAAMPIGDLLSTSPLLTKLLNCIIGGVAVLEMRGRVLELVRCNETYLELTGSSRDYISKSGCTSLGWLTDEDEECFWNLLEQAGASIEQVQGLLRRKTSDNTLLPLLVRVQLLAKEEDQYLFCLAIIEA